MLAVRKTSHAFGRGTFSLLHPGNRTVLAYVRQYEDEVILCVANVSRSAQPVELDLSAFQDRVPVEMLGRNAFPPISSLPYVLTLPAHGFFWFKLMKDVAAPNWHEERPMVESLPILVLFAGWSSLFSERVSTWRSGTADKLRTKFERDLLPAFLSKQRWYAPKADAIERVTVAEHALLDDAGHSWLLALADVSAATGTNRYFLPLALGWEETEEERVKKIAGGAFARIRQQAEVGLIGDAVYDEAYYHSVIRAIGAQRELPAGDGQIRFVPGADFAELTAELPDDLTLVRLPGLGTNSATVLGDTLFLKTFRRLREGLNPELEVGRFLTDVARFEHCVPVAGHIEFVDSEGEVTALALLQRYVPNQGDAWTFAVHELTRELEASITAPAAATSPAAPAPATADGVPGEAITTTTAIPVITGAELIEPIDGVSSRSRTLGRRTAQLHAALSLRTGDPAFDPEPVTASDITSWALRVRQDIVTTIEMLERRQESLPANLEPLAVDVVARRTQPCS